MKKCRNCFYFDRLDDNLGACNNDMFMKEDISASEGGCSYCFDKVVPQSEFNMYINVSDSFGCVLWEKKEEEV